MQGSNLPTPAESHDRPAFNVWMFLLHILQKRKNQRNSLVWICRASHEIRDRFRLDRCFRRIICNVGRRVSKEDGHEDLVIAGIIGCWRVSRSENICSSNGLDIESEDIVAEEDAPFGGRWSGFICAEVSSSCTPTSLSDCKAWWVSGKTYMFSNHYTQCMCLLSCSCNLP